MRFPIFKSILSVLMLGLFVGCSSGGDSSEEVIQPEEPAQATADDSKDALIAAPVEQATFTTFGGDSVSVSDFKGKVIMIDLWETWCKPCLDSFPTLQKLQEDYPDNFVVLAVTPGFTDTPKDAQAFAEEHDYTFNYLLDSQNLHEEIGVQGIPFKLFIDAEGNFIQKTMGSYGPEEDYKKISQIIEQHKRSAQQN